MEYPWNDAFLIEAAEDTGTNEPVDTTSEEEPDPELAQDLTETGDTSELQAEIDNLKKQIEELQKNFDLENEVKLLKKRLDNISMPSDTDLNDSINQSASREVKYIKRAVRRFLSKNKISGLTSAQQDAIISRLEQHPQSSCQEISSQLSKEIGASEQDIFDFIRNSDYRFRHRHWRESSVIDWNVLE
jgi:phosphopantetheine adenylyltransferase